MNDGRTVFSQLTELLPRRAFENAVKRYGGDHRVRSLTCWDQLLSMIFAHLTGRSSLRETVDVLDGLGRFRYHCGFRGPVARSTLADANELRDCRIFKDTAMAMIAALKTALPVKSELKKLNANVYALDSTTVDLCLKLFPWAHFRRCKAGIKAHVALDVGRGIPAFMRVTHAKTHDLSALDHIEPEPGAYYVMDKAYTDYARLYRLHCAGAFFITRKKRNMRRRVREQRPVDGAAGVLSDQLIRLRGVRTCDRYPDTLRVIRFVDPETGKRLQFLTNHLNLDAVMIALLYRKRWQIELFFKWIKQHLRVKAFFGTTPNAVETQLWVAVITYLLVLKCKHEHQITHQASKMVQTLGTMFLQKTPINEAFAKTDDRFGDDEIHNQLLFKDL